VRTVRRRLREATFCGQVEELRAHTLVGVQRELGGAGLQAVATLVELMPEQPPTVRAGAARALLSNLVSFARFAKFSLSCETPSSSSDLAVKGRVGPASSASRGIPPGADRHRRGLARLDLQLRALKEERSSSSKRLSTFVGSAPATESQRADRSGQPEASSRALTFRERAPRVPSCHRRPIPA
jgi:hypothetical protein